MGEKTQTYLDNTGQNHYNYFAKMVFVCAPRNFAGAKERNDLNMANMKKEYKMSAEHKEELQKELTYLKTVREKEVADLIKEARGFGDLSENSEYDEAKNEQAILEAQIKEIQYTLDNCEVVDDDSISLDEVGLGSTIKLKNFQSGKVETWQIVSSNEANFAEHKISDDSPIGKAALKKKVGETFQVFAPVGTLLFEVLEIGK